MATEYLELAPFRKIKKSGGTPGHVHSGAEVAVVLYGSVRAYIGKHGEAESEERALRHGDVIHFCGDYEHYIANTDWNSTALLFVTRVDNPFPYAGRRQSKSQC